MIIVGIWVAFSVPATIAHRPAKVFNSEMETYYGITEGKVDAGDCVICRYEGPRGAPGMPEMLSLTSALVGVGLGKVILPTAKTWRVERRGEFSPLGPRAGCFLALGSGLGLVGTASSRR